MIQESTYIKINETGSDKKFLLLIEFVPCILHLENRKVIKLLAVLLQEGLDNVKNKQLYGNISNDVQRKKMFLGNIEDQCNTKIWGTSTRPTAWEVPFNFKEKRLDDITLDNNSTRKLISNFNYLIDICVIDPVCLD